MCLILLYKVSSNPKNLVDQLSFKNPHLIMKLQYVLTLLCLGVEAFGKVWYDAPPEHIKERRLLLEEDFRVADVAIIGGGEAGTYAAVKLFDMGRSVVLLEPTNSLSRQPPFFIDPKTKYQINMGEENYANTSIVRNFFDRLNINYTRSQIYRETWVDFRAKKKGTFTPPTSDAVHDALTKYIDLLANNMSCVQFASEGSLDTFGKFATSYGLEAAMHVINEHVHNDGNIWEVPTATIVRDFDVDRARSALSGFLTISSKKTPNWYLNAAKIIGNNIHWQANIAYIHRKRPDEVKIFLRKPKGKYTLDWKIHGWDLEGPPHKYIAGDTYQYLAVQKVIMAIPPTKKSTKKFLSFTKREKYIFGHRLRGWKYATAWLNLPGVGTPWPNRFNGYGSKTPFNLSHIPDIYSISETALPDNFRVEFGGYITRARERESRFIHHRIRNLEKQGHFKLPKLMGNYWFHHKNKHGGGLLSAWNWYDNILDHTPFRQAFTTPLAKDMRGLYAQVDDLQGRDNTVWLGPAFSAQDSASMWSHADALVEKLVSKLEDTATWVQKHEKYWRTAFEQYCFETDGPRQLRRICHIDQPKG